MNAWSEREESSVSKNWKKNMREDDTYGFLLDILHDPVKNSSINELDHKERESYKVGGEQTAWSGEEKKK